LSEPTGHNASRQFERFCGRVTLTRQTSAVVDLECTRPTGEILDRWYRAGYKGHRHKKQSPRQPPNSVASLTRLYRAENPDCNWAGFGIPFIVPRTAS